MDPETDFSVCQAFQGARINLCVYFGECGGRNKLKRDAELNPKLTPEAQMTQVGAALFVAACREKGCIEGQQFDETIKLFPLEIRTEE